MDIGECVKKTPEGLYLLSGLLKIDLCHAIPSLINQILELLIVKLSPETSYLPYNFTIYMESTQWFPQGETGPFVNAGLERWTRSVEEWRSEETDEP